MVPISSYPIKKTSDQWSLRSFTIKILVNSSLEFRYTNESTWKKLLASFPYLSFCLSTENIV